MIRQEFGQEFTRALYAPLPTTLAELGEAVQALIAEATIAGADPQDVFLNTEQTAAAALALTLVERTLTDGSKVYDVEVG